MTTWGPSKKQTADEPRRRRSSAARVAGRARGRSRPGRSRRRASRRAVAARRRRGPAASSATPPSGAGRREQATDELRGAVGGPRARVPRHRPDRRRRRCSAWPCTSTSPGRSAAGIETLLGWLVGLGRYAVPVVLVAAGVALVRDGPVVQPVAPGHRLGARRPSPSLGHAPRRQRPRRRSASSTTLGRRRRPRSAPLVGEPLRGAARRRPARSSCSLGARHRRRPADHPDVAAHDGRAHRPAASARSPARSAGRPARRCATCRR